MDKKSIYSLRRSVSPLAVKRASILLITLWSLCLLTVFAVYLGYIARQKISLVRRLDERAKLRFIAEAGIKKAIAELISINEVEKFVFALKDSWSANPLLFKDIVVDDGIVEVCYTYVNENANNEETRYGMMDEERKININTAELGILKRLFEVVLNFNETEAGELAASIIDWRDADSELLLPLGSAEDSYYRDTLTPYEAKDAAYESLDEVLLVKGMTTDVFKKISDYITIYGNGKVNINTASRPVLLALGISSQVLDAIISFRNGQDGVEATSDDNIFNSPSDIVANVSQSSNISITDAALLSNIAERYLKTASNFFLIKSRAQLQNKKSSYEISAVVNNKGKVFYWHELL